MTIHTDYDLSQLLWYKIGGTTKYLLECKSADDVLEALSFIQRENITIVFYIGTGSNLVFPDEYFDGAIVYFAKPDSPSFTKERNKITAYAGEVLGDFIQYGFDNNLIGLEWAGGLPGTVGAAVRGNVGAYGGEIKDSIVSVDVAVVSANGIEVKTFSNEELQFEYRGSVIKENNDTMIVLTATCELTPANEEKLDEARKEYELHIQQRKDRHPLEYPNCGSVFKNVRRKDDIEKVLAVYPELEEKIKNDWYGKVSMGYLIQKLGLQGYRVGDAQISEKHALFIVNLGEAKAEDVRSIIDTVQEKCNERFGFIPEVEVEVL
jgi:UDP-N-acetylmuramate dehydrogenase